ncbi:transposase [Acidobacteriota bacterium]
MARIPRIVVPGFPHHVTQRGNLQQDVFDSKIDRKIYMKLMSHYSSRYGTEIWVYCLMRNHVHFIAIPEKKDSLARTFNQAHSKYTQYWNRKHNIVGHLWHNRFFSVVLDELHLLNATRYIERNPVRAGIVKFAIDYQWSSARAHVHNTYDSLLSKSSTLEKIIHEWLDFIEVEDDAVWIKKFKKQTLRGRPVGNKKFIKKVEKIIGQSLKVKPVGRPRKRRKRKR